MNWSKTLKKSEKKRQPTASPPVGKTDEAMTRVLDDDRAPVARKKPRKAAYTSQIFIKCDKELVKRFAQIKLDHDVTDYAQLLTLLIDAHDMLYKDMKDAAE